MIASVVPSAAWSGQRRYDRTLYTMSCSRAASGCARWLTALGLTATFA
jgi:hypothetical protein